MHRDVWREPVVGIYTVVGRVGLTCRCRRRVGCQPLALLARFQTHTTVGTYSGDPPITRAAASSAPAPCSMLNAFNPASIPPSMPSTICPFT